MIGPSRRVPNSTPCFRVVQVCLRDHCFLAIKMNWWACYQITENMKHALAVSNMWPPYYKSSVGVCRGMGCMHNDYCISLFHSTTRNLMRLALLTDLLRNFLHCWIRWHGTMFWTIFMFDIPVFLIESSRYVAKTKSFLWLLTPSYRRWVSAEFACWENVCSCPSSSEPDSYHQLW